MALLHFCVDGAPGAPSKRIRERQPGFPGILLLEGAVARSAVVAALPPGVLIHHVDDIAGLEVQLEILICAPLVDETEFQQAVVDGGGGCLLPALRAHPAKARAK